MEKDWLSFGHKFGHRSGHLVPDRTSFASLPGEGISAQAAFFSTVQKGLAFSSAAFKETSPVFHQFLDCVYQILHQFPNRFEFDQRLLRDLFQQLFSCSYGTFLFNSEKDRADHQARTSTRSVWERYIGSDEAKRKWSNPQYKPELDDANSRDLKADQGVLLPDPKDLVYWFELFNRSDDEMNSEEPESISEPIGVSDPPVVAVVDATGAAAPQVAAEQPSGLVDNVNKMSLSPASSQKHATPSARPPSPLGSSVPAASNSAPPADALQTPAWAAAAQPAFSNAMTSVWKFGGSSWKSIQKGYQDVVRDYQATSGPSPGEAEHRDRGDMPSTLGSQFDPWRSKSTTHQQTGDAPWSTSSAAEGHIIEKADIEPRHPPRIPTQSNPWSADEGSGGSEGKDPLGVGTWQASDEQCTRH